MPESQAGVVQIEHGSWRINNASPDGWYAVNVQTGAVRGPVATWQDAIAEADRCAS